MSDAAGGIAPDFMSARADDGVLRLDFAVHGRHSWLTFRLDGLDQLKAMVDLAIRQRDKAAKK